MVLALSACGGGGGGRGLVESTPPAPIGPAPSPSPTPSPVTLPSSENFDTTEYRHSSAAIGSNAIGAWQQGATGKGITIGFVDSGLVPTLSDFAGRLHPGSRDFDGNRPMNDVSGHGTAVAGIAAAARDGNGMQGIAFESTIFMAKADNGCPTDCGFDRDAVADGIDAARAAGASVINLSIGGSGDHQIWDAATRAINAGIIIVVAAGNSGSSPTVMASNLASLAPDQVIIVGGLGATNLDGTINYDVPSIYTSQAGSYQSSFLAAPGWLNSATYLYGGIDRLSGTSFAAPVVSGAVALIAQAFPMLTPKQILQLLYQTADDLGAIGTDAIFGRGRLNIGRAFEPVGTTRMANSQVPVPESLGKLPSAAGDAASLGSLMSTVLDDFNRPFEFDLAEGLEESSTAAPLARSLVTGQRSLASFHGPVAIAFTVGEPETRGFASEMRNLSPSEQRSARLLAASVIAKITAKFSIAFGYGTESSNLRARLSQRKINGFMLSNNATTLGFNVRNASSAAFAQRQGSWTISIAGERGSVGSIERLHSTADYGLFGLSIDRRAARGHWRLGASRLIEARTVLGGWVNSTFAKPGSQTWVGDAEFEQRLSRGFSVGGAVRVGRTSFSNGQFDTSAFSVDLTKADVLGQDNTLSIRVSQPSRVERGSIGIVLPVSWDYMTHKSTDALRQLKLKPSGRELSVEAGYLLSLPSGWLSLNAYGRRNPGHVKQSDGDLGVALRAELKL